MNVKELFTDDDAVSPVVGVILMVAITVILAAVIGAFVLNIGSSQDTAPQVSIEFTEDAPKNNVIMNVKSASSSVPAAQYTIKATTLNSTGYSQPTSALSAGFTHTIKVGQDSSGEAQVVWSSPESDKTSILGSYEYSV
jgi:flagellin-like protein